MLAAALSAGIAAGVLLAVAVAVVCLYDVRIQRRGEDGKIAAVWWRRKWSSPAGKRAPRDPEKGQTSARVADGPDLPEEEEKQVTGEEETKKPDEEDDGRPDTALSTVQKFAWEEVEEMTEMFSTAVIGEGGFSTVYLARLGGAAVSSAALGAVKVHSSGSGSERLHRAFRQELEVLLRLRHPHIVRLLGYCDDREDGVLVLEYVPNGTLHEKLHGGDGAFVLPWAARMSVALQLAQAVEHLHDGCGLPIVHCDLKASNVLLDRCLDCKLCDFGSSLTGFESAVAQRRHHPTVMGSPGYVDPHYLRTGVVSKKGDVYSFGVLLLELLTGGEAFCSEKEQMLTTAVAGALPAAGEDCRKRVPELVDLRLGAAYDAAEAAAVAALAARCIAEQPSVRPSMSEVARSLRRTLPAVGRLEKPPS